MNLKRIIVTVVFAALNAWACTALAESSVWKVSKGDNYFYLGATIHLLKADDHPLPEEFARAYSDAGTIVFETDLVESQRPEFQSRFMAAMMYRDERTLASELKPEIYRQLEDFMALRNIPLAHFSKFQPWGVALMITMLEYQRLGMVSTYGVDAYFNRLARADNKTIISLETPEEQLRFISESMTGIDPDKGIEYTLRDLNRLPEFIALMKENWRSGDLETFAESAFIVQMKKEFPEMYAILVTERNNNWMRQIATLTNDGDTEFVLVGAMHLNGQEGLLNQLRIQGFDVEQL